ncbi:MAG: Mut7-C RNAse domain-containing protein [Halanaerobium sp.]
MIKIKTIKLRFYSYLNNFIKADAASNLELIDDRYYLHHYRGRQTIKDIIESLGIPHPEVSLILRNSQPVDFSELVQPGDFFSIYPYLYSCSLPAEIKLMPKYPLEKPKFILDVHLGRLARYLRRFGFDTAYKNDYQDREIVNQALKEKRIILSRDRGLLMRKRVKWAQFIWDDDPKKQLQEVFKRFALAQYYQGESRCVNCNSKLVEIDKEMIIERLEPKTKKYFEDFKYCPKCDKIYWRGSHFKKTEKLLAELDEKR